MVLELREPSRSSDEYARITKELQRVISSDNGISLYELVIVAPKTIPKTTSGKISRSRVKKEYEEGTLSIVYSQRFSGEEESVTQTFEIENPSSSTRKTLLTELTPIDEQVSQPDTEEILLPSQLDQQNTVLLNMKNDPNSVSFMVRTWKACYWRMCVIYVAFNPTLCRYPKIPQILDL